MPSTHSRRRALKSIGAVVLGGSLGGCLGFGTGSAESDTNTVEATYELVFEPATITVPVGETVRWKSTGSVTHTVTAYEDRIPDDAAYFASGGFDSERAAREGYPPAGGLSEGETFEHTFEVPGSYEYFCIPHEEVGMKGTVVVEEA